MIVLFVNAHRSTQEGKSRFNLYYKQLKKILKNTIYYGNEITQIIKTKYDLQQYIYDQLTYQCDQKSKSMFHSLQYVFIDGDSSSIPWNKSNEQLTIFIRACLKENKKIHCNALAHYIAYYYLSTNFDKPLYIENKQKITEANQKRVDYQFDQITGDLNFRGKKVYNSGIKILKESKRPFSAKSKQAVSNGAMLPTKYHYVIFNSKNGQKILKNINFPFTFYWKGSIICTQKSISKAKANILVETELGNPFAFTYKSCLSTQGLSSEFLIMIQNWINQSVGKLQESESKLAFGMFQTISLDNHINLKKTINHDQDENNFKTISQLKNSKLTQSGFKLSKTINSRPLSSKYGLSDKLDKSTIRCGGKYMTDDQRYMQSARVSNMKNLGRSRMMFQGSLAETQIKNYVNLIPGRPVTAHKFRQVEKNKWMDDRNFFLS